MPGLAELRPAALDDGVRADRVLLELVDVGLLGVDLAGEVPGDVVEEERARVDLGDRVRAFLEDLAEDLRRARRRRPRRLRRGR